MFWDTEQTKSFAVSWLKSILLYNYGAGNKRRWEMSYSRVSLFSLLAKSRILSFTRNIWRKMSFQVKFQFKIRQKCRSKWNDIGHTLELGHSSRPGAGWIVWHSSRQMNYLSFQESPDKSQISYFLLCNYIDLFIPVAILESDRLFNHA